MKSVDIFICTKPLQYINLCNIPTDESNSKILIIIDAFYKASEFSKYIENNEHQWSKVIFLKRINTFYKIFRYRWLFFVLFYNVDKLYYSLDSTVIGLLHFIKRFKFFLYEEGAGTYRKQRIQNKYKAIAKMFGTSEIMGFSKYIKGAFVYYPDYYKSQIAPSCPISRFTLSYRETIRQMAKKFLCLYDLDSQNEEFLKMKDSTILLYITDWEIQHSTISQMENLRNEYDYLFIKPHPHIRIKNMPNILGVEVLYTNLIVEIIIDTWLKNNNRVTVLHQDSTAVTPFGNEIKSINVSETPHCEYREIIENLTRLSCLNGKN